jgi:hypothetical protein
VYQRGDVNEFHDHGEIDMPGFYLSGGAASKQSQQGAKAFASAPDSIDDVTLDCGIERRGLLCDARLDLLEVRLN